MQGVIAAIPTPVDGAGKFNATSFLKHANWAVENGCDGLNVLGSTGEASTFSVAERKAVMKCAAQNLPVHRLMVGTGTPSLDDTLELTLYAAKLGFPVALVLPPYYYKPISNDGLGQWFDTLDRQLGDSPTEIYFYNYPQMTGYAFPVQFIAELHAKAPTRFTGIKDSSGDLDYCSEIVTAAENLKVFPSSETSLAEGRSRGFAGCISATANITAPICQRVWSQTSSSIEEDAKALEDLRTAIAANPLIPAVKYLVGRRLDDRSIENVLPPFQPLNAEQRASLDAKFS